MSQVWFYLTDLHNVLWPPWLEVAQIICSMACGTIIGLERRARHKPAGLRTLMLICVGSTIFTMVSILLVNGKTGDPGRIASQVVTGVGFLGAGAILRDRGTVRGLTTAATIWVVAAIGVLIGAGYAIPGVVTSLLVLGVLTLFRGSEHQGD